MMYPCSNCLENRWVYKHQDGMILASCEICGNEVEFEAKKRRKKMQTGDLCRKCGALIEFRKSKFKKKKLKKKYYYTGYYWCNKCRTFYYSDEFKVFSRERKI